MSTIAYIGPRSHFRNRKSTLIGVLVGIVLASIAAHTMPGCSTYTKPDGSTVRAEGTVKIEAATTGTPDVPESVGVSAPQR